MPRLSHQDRFRAGVENLENREMLTAVGSLDPSFGTAGVVLIPADSPPAFVGLTTVIVHQSSSTPGPIEVAGVLQDANGTRAFGLEELKADGSLATTFGINGVVTIPLPSGFTVAPASISPGPTLFPNGQVTDLAGNVSNAQGQVMTLVAQINPDGTLAAGFGSNNGVNVYDLPGFVVTAGAAENGSSVLVGTVLTSDPIENPIGLARISFLGQLDTSIGSSGLITMTVNNPAAPQSAQDESPVGVAVDDQNRIVVAGRSTLGAEVFRFNPDGSRDTSLAGDGLAIVPAFTIPYLSGLALEPSGGDILLLGTQGPTLKGPKAPDLVVHLFANGGTDTAQNLRALADSSPTRFDQIAVQSNGDVVVAGLDGNPGASTTPFVVARLLPDLTPDNRFGTFNGQEIFGYPDDTATTGATLTGLTLDALGNPIVIGGNVTTSGSTIAGETFVARLTGRTDVLGDYTGDGKADLAIYLPDLGAFAIRPSQGGSDQIISFGIAGAGQTLPASGDYDGSGQTEIAAYLPSLGVYAYRPASGGPDVTVSLGNPGQGIPAPGDYEGLGRADAAIYLPTSGSYEIHSQAGINKIEPFGIAGVGQSIPVPGDYDGSGQTELGVYLTAYGAFAYRPALGGPDVIVPFGIPGAGQSIPVPGDYDGSGKTELAVYLPAFAEFVYRPAAGGPDVVIPFGLAGKGQTLPAIGDYSGVGHDEVGGYLPAFGLFAYRPTNGPDILDPFGPAGIGQSIPTNLNSVQGQASLVNAAGFSDFLAQTDDLVAMSLPGSTRKKHSPGVG